MAELPVPIQRPQRRSQDGTGKPTITTATQASRSEEAKDNKPVQNETSIMKNDATNEKEERRTTRRATD